MFGVSFTELLTIGIVILVVFGPDKLPEAARTLGKLFAELKRQSDSLKREVHTAFQFDEDIKRSMGRDLNPIKQELISVKKELDTIAVPTTPTPPPKINGGEGKV